MEMMPERSTQPWTLTPEPRQRQGDRESQWVQFDGTSEVDGDTAKLVPREDAAVLVVMPAEDVRTVGGVTELRVGSRAIAVTIPASSLPNYPTEAANEDECRGAGTRCVGKVKFCCDSNETSGSCRRPWRCP